MKEYKNIFIRVKNYRSFYSYIGRKGEIIIEICGDISVNTFYDVPLYDSYGKWSVNNVVL